MSLSPATILAADADARRAIVAGDHSACKVALLVDHTQLKQECTTAHIVALCAQAREHDFRSVCIPPSRVALARSLLVLPAQLSKADAAGAAVRVCTVVGFPNGYMTTAAKVAETADAVAAGADEIDFVQNVGWVKDANWTDTRNEYRAIVAAAGPARLVKVILETALLTPDEIERCSTIAVQAGIHTVKTSTGFAARGASLADVEAMQRGIELAFADGSTPRRVVGIKASGGIRDTVTALQFIRAGATRLGTSSGVAIISGLQHHQPGESSGAAASTSNY
ncbi:deoxyribose-phosphate aldolase [Capsaspora owczarzaki ATCC 30864]|uniref:deoxyribose-phosphate aldolase n=1 Tax=Capsaspora owczarzaki (strain ATCC 30864) TaxID=595528 RepID=A0A0D2VQ87_CAPO3|nr:deoxyribose-phosphate aldolase [Capsaspora owczarzaki ATCC 30864]KJE92767.1 deoxyribose-phosphate aldolase [Capsaspora owczarzaki ATCC 30864]|eukprot:XP_004363400.1 deoxyribose-phosphate aldolase [Capsaspora owczarzaki ATCC 30864]